MPLNHTLYLEEMYGVTKQMADLLTPEIQINYMKAVLIVAGADGLSPTERAYAAALQRACGLPEEAIEELSLFVCESADPRQALGPLAAAVGEQSRPAGGHEAGMKRSIVYDAIRVASRDGSYSDKERKRLREVAGLMGIPADVVITLESIVEIETSVRRARLAVLIGA